ATPHAACHPHRIDRLSCRSQQRKQRVDAIGIRHGARPDDVVVGPASLLTLVRMIRRRARAHAIARRAGERSERPARPLDKCGTRGEPVSRPRQNRYRHGCTGIANRPGRMGEVMTKLFAAATALALVAGATASATAAEDLPPPWAYGFTTPVPPGTPQAPPKPAQAHDPVTPHSPSRPKFCV